MRANVYTRVLCNAFLQAEVEILNRLRGRNPLVSPLSQYLTLDGTHIALVTTALTIS